MLLLLTSACFLGRLSEDEACDLSQRWITQNGVVIQSEAVYGGTVTRCSNFQSRQDAGSAEIRATVEWSNESEGVSITKTGTADCYLLKYDQGWDVEACADTSLQSEDASAGS